MITNYNDLHGEKTYKNLYLIQRMHMRNKDCNVRFSQRFENDYMGSTEFEVGEMAKRIRELNESNQVGEIMVDGMFMLTLFNPKIITLKQVERELNRLYHGEVRTKEWTNFTREYRRSRQERLSPTNAWFDITNGIFWTWERCNINDVRKNIKLSVDFMDGKLPYEMPEVTEPTPQPVDPLRQRMIDEGRLRPSSR